MQAALVHLVVPADQHPPELVTQVGAQRRGPRHPQRGLVGEQQAFSHAQYLLLSHKASLRVAWTPALRAYVGNDFRLVLVGRHYKVYERRLHPLAS